MMRRLFLSNPALGAAAVAIVIASVAVPVAGVRYLSKLEDLEVSA